jgi:DNA-binding CsgD family transcriptional regulator
MKSELSARELAVLTLAVQGHTDDMIAGHLGIERGTVNSYWVRIRGKLGNYSRTELVARHVQKNADATARELVAERDTLAATTKEVLDKANSEIERLKELLARANGQSEAALESS